MTRQVFTVVLLVLSMFRIGLTQRDKDLPSIVSEFTVEQQKLVKELRNAGVEFHQRSPEQTDQLFVSLHNADDIPKRIYQLRLVPKIVEMSLTLSRENADKSLRHLRELASLQSLALRRSELTEKSAQHLKGASGGLVHLYLNEIELPEPRPEGSQWLSQLQELESLRELNLRESNFASHEFEQLGELRQVYHLDLSRTAVEDKNLVFLERLEQLRTLDLSGTSVTDEGFKHFGKLTSVKTLFFSSMVQSITGSGLRYLAGLENLEWVHITGRQTGTVNDEGLAQLHSVPELRVIQLDGHEVTDVGLKHLGKLHSLELLTLFHPQTSGQGFSSFAELTALRTVEIIDGGLSDEGLKAFGTLQNVETLNLWGNTGITDQGLEKLPRLSKLKSLMLHGTGVSYLGLQHLGKHPKLTGVSISAVGKISESLPSLANFTNLKTVSLRNRQPFPVSDEVLQEQADMIRRALPQCKVSAR